ncbi:hypothetical protein J422_02330 [Methanocaldococcus villosus KIN24-T80]|uniref:YjbQ family protein n=1 Tax=Methanocaldococcus villosus KIN24-T80 TaxID=1069083 RepID=N6VR96_9EURY|nr:hypothetical protein J422_02330 [Methanocaldococcus villosus KIN24-T80]
MLFTYTVRSKKREELIDITNLLLDAIKRSGVNEGFAIIYAPHTTAAITINENADPTVKGDIINYLSKLIPKNYNYKHLEGNSDAHIKSSIIGCSEMIIIKDGKPILGTWQVYFLQNLMDQEKEKFI